ncbi:Ppx/GppA phosphatase family protein [Eubacterium aggregans]|uniref:Ppx/GppA phosphatase family protein n=1 Tax=Eubacterium aggregans TaxID=81409 RepID=UPI0023F0B3F7|nr:exopolyphosphatase [Eubacterium aggregans]MDD4692167.1 exopolyphosphatase [Eubacterium aggregans]
MIKRFAAIYIGSSKCEMVVGQRGKGTINILDRTMYPIDFGRQSFSRGTITFQSVYALSRILNEYIEIAEASAVDEIEIIGTAALREAINRDYVLEQIRVFTGGHSVRLLKREEETELLFRYMAHICGQEILAPEEDTVLTAISSGSIAVALVSGGTITTLQNEEMGYLKLMALYKTMEERTGNFESLLTDFIAIRTRDFKKNLEKRSVANLVVTSHDVENLAALCEIKPAPEGYFEVSEAALTKLRKEISNLSAGQLQKRYPVLGPYQAETIRHTLLLVLKLMADTGVHQVKLVRLSVCDAQLEFKLGIGKTRELDKWIDASSIASARYMAKRYLVDQAHNAAVEKIALRLFGALKGQYQMGRAEEQFLRLAAILLDIGRFVGEDDGGCLNRRIIESSDIIGLDAREKRVLGRIVDGVRLATFEKVEDDEELRVAERLQVAKIIAILKLATALDKSHKQRVDKIRCHLDAKAFEVTVQTKGNIQLEEYYFALGVQAMKDVYGIEPSLRVKRVSI